ncbi:hypothetical protein CF319_g6079 [Tilletia indica]|nr:hypothetical protein CF319_g6079 [Tilletia indica]
MARRAVRFVSRQGVAQLKIAINADPQGFPTNQNLDSPDVEDLLDEEMELYAGGRARSADEELNADGNDEDDDDQQQARNSANERYGDSHDSTQDEDAASSPPPRVFSVQTCGAKIGCAFYDVTTGKLSLLEDAPEEGRRVHTHSMSGAGEDEEEEEDTDNNTGKGAKADDDIDTAKETLMTLLEQFAPVNLVLTNSDSSARFHTAVRKELIYQDSVLSIRPSTEFNTTSGMQRIHSLQLQEQHLSATDDQMDIDQTASTSASTQPSSAPTTTSFGNKLQSSCAVDLHVMPLSVGAAGALLSHLTRIQASFDHYEGYTSDAGGSTSTENTLKITSIESIVLQDCLSISTESRIALDVFGEESHAALHSASRKHEGLSLFAILDSTRTPLSHSLLRRWLLLPTTDIGVIESRQAAIATFSSHKNTPATQSITRELKGVKNIPVMVSKLLNGTSRLSDWKAVLKFCYHALIIREAILDLSVEEPVEVIQKAKMICDKRVLNFCSQNIAGIIDFDESASESRICIKSGYDEELDQWKQLYAGLPDLLNKIAQDIRPDVDQNFKEM